MAPVRSLSRPVSVRLRSRLGPRLQRTTWSAVGQLRKRWF